MDEVELAMLLESLEQIHAGLMAASDNMQTTPANRLAAKQEAQGVRKSITLVQAYQRHHEQYTKTLRRLDSGTL